MALPLRRQLVVRRDTGRPTDNRARRGRLDRRSFGGGLLAGTTGFARRSKYSPEARMMWWRRKREADLERELRAHIELEAEDKDDRDSARRAFGNVTRTQEEVRESWGWMWL